MSFLGMFSLSLSLSLSLALCLREYSELGNEVTAWDKWYDRQLGRDLVHCCLIWVAVMPIYVPHCRLRLCPTLPSRRFRLPPSKYFLQTVLGLCYSFLSWFTYVSRRWQTVLDILNFAVVQSLKRPASDRDWRFSHVTLAFVWRFHRYSGGTSPVSILSLLLGRRTARVTQTS